MRKMVHWKLTTTRARDARRNGVIMNGKHRDRTNRGLGVFLSAVAGIAIAGVMLTQPASAGVGGNASSSAAANRTETVAATTHVLPEWFRAYAFRYHHGRHAAPCILVGAEFHPHKRAAICADGFATVVPRRMIPARPHRISPDTVAWFHWWGTDRDSAIEVAGFRSHARLAVVVGDDGYLAVG